MILDPFEYLAPAWRGGEEHLVWRDQENDRVVKLTHPNCFGLTVTTEWFVDEDKDEASLKPALRGATPLEYFERLLLHNEVFADNIELLGIVDKRTALHVVTAQPAIRGDAAPVGKIIEFMEALGFLCLPDMGVGRLGAASFLRLYDQVAVFDCHPANFLETGGNIVPIDALVIRADEPLLTTLAV